MTQPDILFYIDDAVIRSYRQVECSVTNAAILFNNDDGIIKPKSEKKIIHLSLLPKTHMKFSIYL